MTAYDEQLSWQPIAYVRSERSEPTDDDWDEVVTSIELAEPYGPESLIGLDEYSHLDVVFVFDRLDPAPPAEQSRRPRGNPEYPVTGIFAQRNADRPNRIGVTTCELLSVEGTTLHVRGLDAIDGTPVVDLKPYWSGFAPRTPVREPSWSKEITAHYWGDHYREPKGMG